MPIPKVLQDRLRLPIIGAPMFIVSTPALVLAQCKAGIVGSFPALNARPAAQLDDWLAEITAELAGFARDNPTVKVAPYAVNQIVHSSNDRLEQDVRLCVKHRVPIVITSLRPPAEVVSAIQSYGGVVFHDVINLRHAEKAAQQGVDGIIAVCAGAGGHAGLLSPFALVKQIREIYGGTILLSGAMSTGADVLAAQALGADLAYMGTRFIATVEGNASAAYKQMLVDARAEDIVYTSLFSGIPGNYLRAASRRRGWIRTTFRHGGQDHHEFRHRRQHGTQGVERYLERRSERQRDSRRREGRRSRGPARERICRSAGRESYAVERGSAQGDSRPRSGQCLSGVRR
jgi:nitronate monooxygenase